MRRAVIPFCLLALSAACGDRTPEPPPAPITIFAAASLSRPLQALTDAYARQTRVASLVEIGGSIEHARKITDLGRTPDVVILVDDDVIASLVPAHLDWYVRFATNRIVVAYGPRSRHADSISGDNWWRILARSDVQVGRADPAVAPAGRQALAMLRRAASHHAEADLVQRVLARSPERLMRPNATELAALLETAEVDYILEYESVARQYGFRFVGLPVEVAQPVLYGAGVPKLAANPGAGVDFLAAMLSPRGRDILSASHVDLLRVPVAVGSNIPSRISEVVRTLTTSAPAGPAR